MNIDEINSVIDLAIDKGLHNLVSKDKWLVQEWQTLFHEFFQEILVTDEKGFVIWATSEDDQQHIGRNVFDLEKSRAFYPCISAKVLRSGQREKGLQYTQSGGVFMIDSIPIKNDKGDIVRVVSITKDASEINEVSDKITELKNLMDNYRREVIQIQQEKLEKQPFVYKNKKMDNINELIKSVASVDASVLILGETGVGKQVVANQIHMLSNRSDQLFITVNCGAIPESLLESELFGYEEGAFSGARKGGKLGIFELAHKGTVFLDEIGEIPLHLQVKLLHVLQDKMIMKVGGTREKKVDVRIISATNRDLKKMIKDNNFREDLYYRINTIPIHIPPLRERKEDIYVFIHHFLRTFNKQYLKNAEIGQKQLEQLLKYSWPGNVRELENVIERFVVTGQLDALDQEFLSVYEYDRLEDKLPNLMEYIAENEKRLLIKAMKQCKTTREMAKCLGVNQSTIVRKMQKYNL
ncbi:sigma-54 interaction domain-containing protein [Scopulibacillus cellulosilyticus]|uniref:HTH-type transcriptional regulatory protein TyrR n=1 Tax=Scopulibacillus cellulosilyticus TaxID=2665665 RepID=A0ABW2PPT3_9BACL